MGVVRAMGKRALEAALIRSGFDRLGRRLRRGRVTVLAYHNIVPDSAPRTGDGSLHLPVRVFAEQLDMLCEFGRVVSLRELLDRSRHEPSHGGAFVITFDDGYRGSLRLGIPELARRGLPATIFVAPSLLGDRTFWWDALGAGEGARGLQLRDRILAAGGTPEAARRMALELDVEVRTVPECWRSATERELRTALSTDGITVASHGWSHTSLIRVSDEDLANEVRRPRTWLQDRFGISYLDVLSYPYGFHSATVRRAARDAGYRAGFALEPGSVPDARPAHARADLFRLPRLNVPSGLSPAGLRIRVAWA